MRRLAGHRKGIPEADIGGELTPSSGQGHRDRFRTLFPLLAAHPAANPFVESASYRQYIENWEQQYLKQVAKKRGKH